MLVYPMKVYEIYRFLDQLAPFDTAEEFDNCGLLVGDPDQEVTKIGLALDITHAVIRQAVKEGIDLIITHHPVIFHPLKQVQVNSTVYQLIRNGISVISAHTNLDKAETGVNAVLAKYYCLQNIASPLCLDDLGRLGNLPAPMPVPEYAALIKKNLGASGVRYYDSGKPVQKAAYISGSGGSMMQQVLSCDIDTFITGDLKHDAFIDAQNLGLNLIEVGHFDSENVVFFSLAEQIEVFTNLSPILLSRENPVKTI